MCVIIYVPKGEQIENDELNAAWERNSHGAGFMFQKNGKVYYERGIMSLEEYKEKIKPIMGKYELILHLRISTSNAVNKLQTHPYEVGNIANQKGVTTNPVVCMNGIVKNLDKTIKDCNDTMSYIIENNLLFMDLINKEISDETKLELTEFLKEDTSAKWCIMTPTNIFFTSGFISKKKLKFSNLLHNSYKNVNTFYKDYYNGVYDIRDVIKKAKLRKTLYRNYYDLYLDIEDYAEEYCTTCNGNTLGCIGCLKQCKSIPSIKQFKKNNKEKFDDLYYIEYNYIKDENKYEKYDEDYQYECDYDYTSYNIFDE